MLKQCPLPTTSPKKPHDTNKSVSGYAKPVDFATYKPEKTSYTVPALFW